MHATLPKIKNIAKDTAEKYIGTHETNGDG